MLSRNFSYILVLEVLWLYIDLTVEKNQPMLIFLQLLKVSHGYETYRSSAKNSSWNQFDITAPKNLLRVPGVLLASFNN